MPRGTAEEREAIARRQERVWHLRVVRKLTEHEVGQLMSISRRTITRDLAAMRARGQSAVALSAASEKAVVDAGLQAASELDAIVRQAWTDCMAAPDGSLARVGYLNLVLKSIGERLRILQSLGLMKKVPEEVLLGDLDLRQLSDSEAESALTFLRACARGAGGPAGGPAGGAAESQAVDRSEPVDSHEG
jgi:predicted DNA-binding protein (UPF0251 family)